MVVLEGLDIRDLLVLTRGRRQTGTASVERFRARRTRTNYRDKGAGRRLGGSEEPRNVLI